MFQPQEIIHCLQPGSYLQEGARKFQNNSSKCIVGGRTHPRDVHERSCSYSPISNGSRYGTTFPEELIICLRFWLPCDRTVSQIRASDRVDRQCKPPSSTWKTSTERAPPCMADPM